ncbi:cytochrome P450 3A24-like [Paramacrobiotus metropolitanus]|uniref:cytochrome P450 3A24-like n=1 Tax=Paramacrobiotus metropolitanus TaxID=2943436 RepID=UPI0024463B09|nr:cytochrome P450 3A24-like [Paramacrobiotus metropolitanus]
MILELVLSILVLFVTYMLFDVIYKNSYWRRKGVPGPFQYPLSSSFAELTKIGPARFDEKCIRKFGNVFGVFEGSMPVIVISDLEMLKSIMVKDFTHFVNRRGFQRGNKSVLNLALTKLKDQHWKDVRSVVAPTFTSGKLRLMTALLHECCETLCESINTIAEKGAEIEARRLYLPATLDIITSTFFATKVNSQDPNSTFMRHVRNAFATKMNLLVYIAFYFPRLLPLAEKLGMQTSNKASTDYFVDSIKEIIRMRLETKKAAMSSQTP